MKGKISLSVIVFVLLAAGQSFAQGLASGFAISEKYVLTAYTVVGNERSVQLRFSDGDWMAGEYAEGNADEGWCLLKISRSAPAFVTVESKNDTGAGDKVYVFGVDDAEGSQGRISFKEGNVISMDKDSRLGTIIRHSVAIDMGAIGGALFSDDNDCAIGIVIGDQSRSGKTVQKAISLFERTARIRQYVGQQDKSFRKSNRKAVCAIRSGVAGTTDDRRLGSRQNSSNDTNTETYQKCKDSVATIEGDEGSGTGFLCEMDGKKYFVTNRHVARQRGRMTAFFLDGKKMEFDFESKIEVAENRDLVRFEVQSDRPSLKLVDELPCIGDKVEFYGNAGGQKVVTVTAGKMLAVGQERIEIDSPIQGGNSGSPLVRISDGCVVGVTTISTFNRIAGDPSKVGTRYDPNVKLTREFAVRFAGVTWKTLSYRSFLKAINVYSDLGEFYVWMLDVCGLRNGNASWGSQIAIFEYQLPDLKFVGATQLNDYIKKIAKCDEALKKVNDRWVMMREKNRENPAMVRYGKTEFENVYKSWKDKASAACKVRKEVLGNVVSYCKMSKVLSKEEREDAVEAFDRLLRKYCEKYRMELKGVFPKPNN